MCLGRRFQNKSCNISSSHKVRKSIPSKSWRCCDKQDMTSLLENLSGSRSASPLQVWLYILKNCIKHTLIIDLSEDWGVPEGITTHAELISLERGVLKAVTSCLTTVRSQLLTEHLTVGSGAKRPEWRLNASDRRLRLLFSTRWAVREKETAAVTSLRDVTRVFFLRCVHERHPIFCWFRVFSIRFVTKQN